MWRLLLKRTHPDHGGTDELFVWCQALHEHVAGDGIEEPPRSTRREPPQHPTTGDRVEFVYTYTNAGSFEDLTGQAVDMASRVGEPYAFLLRLLVDCHEVPQGDRLHSQQHQGATYRTLAAIGHRVGMSKAERVRWYEVCRQVPLSQRHAGHILSRL